MLRDLAIKTDKSLAEFADLVQVGQAANHFASQAAFDDFRARKAANTLRRHDANLALFAEFIKSTGAGVGDLASDPQAWRGISWGLVAAFQGWLLGRGYSVSTVNVTVSTVKTYARLAFKAGALSATDYALIRGVEGFAHREKPRIDEKRKAAGLPTRASPKKAQAVKISPAQARKLKAQPDTPQGRRDGLMFCLLLDHGLRVGELAGLRAENFDLEAGIFTFERPKVGGASTHKMTADTLRAARAYLGAHQGGALLMGSVKGGALRGKMSTRAICARVGLLGAEVGLSGLSPHDARHYAASQAARRKNLRELMDLFGWTSPAMAARYLKSAEVVDPE